MSESESGPGRREVAHRVFATEFDDATVSYRERDEERAPNYVITPTGARANRVFVVGVLTEVEPVNDGVVRARIADPTGAFVSYAGQYQPEALAAYDRLDTPSVVALTGKARTFEPDDDDRVYTSVRPETVTEVDAATRDRWIVSAAEATLSRLTVLADALDRDARGEDLRAELLADGVREPLAAGAALAIERYGTTAAYLDEVGRVAVEALELVAGDRETVEPLGIAPSERGDDVAIGPLLDGTGGSGAATVGDTDSAARDRTGGTSDAAAVDDEPPGGAEAGANAETDTDVTAGANAETDTDVDADSKAETDTDVEAATATPSGATATEEADETRSDIDAARADSRGEIDVDTGGRDVDADAAPEAGTGDEPEGGSAGGEADTATAAGSDEATPTDGLGDFDPGDETEYELDEAEREAVKSEYGTEFETGTEVDEPGEADIDVPDADGTAGGDDASTEVTTGSDDAPTESAAEGQQSADSGETETEDESGAEAEVDLEAAAVAAMESLDDGTGADREAVVARVVEEHGADPGDVEEAVQDALMSGRCYEPDEATLKPI